MTTHHPTSLPTALRGAQCAVGTWMPASSLFRSSSRRPGAGIAGNAGAAARKAAPH